MSSVNHGRSWGRTSNIPAPNIYVRMLSEYKDWIYIEDEASQLKGKWRGVFENSALPLDLEIGCGNGFFFEHQVKSNPQRNHLGIELKYKPLVQTIRRVKKLNLPNGRGIRFHGAHIEELFSSQELDNVFIFFPDPWPKKKQNKNRLVRREFFAALSRVQKQNAVTTIKTDSREYFDFMVEEVKDSPYRVDRLSYDLHSSEWATENFPTGFEKIFLKQNLPIHYMRLTNKSL